MFPQRLIAPALCVFLFVQSTGGQDVITCTDQAVTCIPAIANLIPASCFTTTNPTLITDVIVSITPTQGTCSIVNEDITVLPPFCQGTASVCTATVTTTTAATTMSTASTTTTTAATTTTTEGDESPESPESSESAESPESPEDD